MGRPHRDLTDQRFERLVAKEFVGSDKRGNALWRCECDCGNKNVVVVRGSLVNHTTLSCGCLYNEIIEERSKQCDKLINTTINRLTILERVPPPKGNKSIHFLCVCECNEKVVVSKTALLNGVIKSCGCLHAEQQAACMEANRIGGTNVAVVGNNRPGKRNKSGVKGVHMQKGRWIAEIRFQNQKYYLGSFVKLDDAADVRRKAEDKIHGPFLNWYEANIRPLPNRNKQYELLPESTA